MISTVLFVVGLRYLGSPDTARKGNLLAATGMGLAVIATILSPSMQNHIVILAGILVGAILGFIGAKRVEMTAMPQMVSLFNGLGGACAMLIGIMEFSSKGDIAQSMMTGEVFVILIGLIIGAVSFTGSLIAMGKLQGKIKDKKLNGIFGLILLVASLGLGGYIMTLDYADQTLLIVLLLTSSLYGIIFVMPIGGADMPVVISLLNSFTGVTATAAGFLYSNQAMIMGGILVGYSGLILTFDMCKAMNRSLVNVIFGSFGGASTSAASGGQGGSVKEISHTDAGILMSYSQKIVIVPGYGLAVAQAQHTAHELEALLEDKGVEVKYAIHPVAGRMPGHMNVLLAEADVPYPKLVEMDDINPEFENTDVAIVIGANDVVNPAAKDDPSSPIHGMPVLNVENAKNVIVLKRSMGKGYAGIENQLFFKDKTRMLFGDAKSSLQKLVEEVKAN